METALKMWSFSPGGSCRASSGSHRCICMHESPAHDTVTRVTCSHANNGTSGLTTEPGSV